MSDSNPLMVFNFGAGVQSTAILHLMLEGELPRPDYVVMADTGWEPTEVYLHANRCEALCQAAGLPFVVVRYGDIRAAHVRRAGGVPTCGSTKVDPSLHSLRTMPLYLLNPATGKRGMVRRSCTERYKVRPVERFIRSLLGRKRKGQRPVIQVFGISTDEAERERISQRKGWSFWYPLLTLRPMSRRDCIAYLTAKQVVAPKSACVGCPYRNREQWATIRADVGMWLDAVAFDAAIRHMPGLDSAAFLHPQRVPLPLVDWEKGSSREEHAGMRSECVGMCGV